MLLKRLILMSLENNILLLDELENNYGLYEFWGLLTDSLVSRNRKCGLCWGHLGSDESSTCASCVTSTVKQSKTELIFPFIVQINLIIC